jgi:hypothetical protein
VRALTIFALLLAPLTAAGQFRAGAAAVDITPTRFPVIINGMFEERTANTATDPLHARGLVLDEGATRIAIVIVDSCMMPRELLDRAKDLIRQSTGISTDHILIAATHTHSAPAAMGCLGSRADAAYVEFLVPQLVRTVELANRNLAPAQVGWAVVQDPEHTYLRRWIRRPDRILTDPFGEKSVRANMHPGYLSPDAIGPSGPADPGLSVLAVRSPGGQPIALLANYSMHYYGSTAVSADYFGRFADEVTRRLGGDGKGPPCVGIMSQGTSGDLYRVDYSKPQRPPDTIDEYSAALAGKAIEAYRSIRWQDSAPLAMDETLLMLRRRTPSPERLEKCKKIVAELKGTLPTKRNDIYALEQIYLDKEPARELKIQGIRIGDLGIAAIPNEVFALTGLKIKAQSPLQPTFTIELANGAEGYIPPPEQHALGGYTTWPARTAALEVQAEPRIVEIALRSLEEVAGKRRRKVVEPLDGYVKAVLASKPVAYWRLDEMEGDVAHDATGHGHYGTFNGGHAFYLDGRAPGSHAVHFAGGRLRSDLADPGLRYSIEMWAWNGLPPDVRLVTGTLTSRMGEAFSLGGTSIGHGRLLAGTAKGEVNHKLIGSSDLMVRTWYHVAFVRDGSKVTLYLDGKPDAAGELPRGSDGLELSIGGSHIVGYGWEGKLQDVAVYDRPLTADEVAAHYRAAVRTSP